MVCIHIIKKVNAKLKKKFLIFVFAITASMYLWYIHIYESKQM